jgi:hypothetical protein
MVESTFASPEVQTLMIELLQSFFKDNMDKDNILLPYFVE